MAYLKVTQSSGFHLQNKVKVEDFLCRDGRNYSLGNVIYRYRRRLVFTKGRKQETKRMPRYCTKWKDRFNNPKVNMFKF